MRRIRLTNKTKQYIGVAKKGSDYRYRTEKQNSAYDITVYDDTVWHLIERSRFATATYDNNRYVSVGMDAVRMVTAIREEGLDQNKALPVAEIIVWWNGD